jgi:dipeptidyl-peptidase-4
VTGVARLVLRETDPCWVELHSDLWFLEESRQFIWASERDGFKHLYLYDWGGNLIRQLSRGPWPVGKLRGVDEERGLAYWEGWTESPLEQHLYRVALAEGVRTAQPERVS